MKSSLRQEQARSTRQRIAAAATALLGEQGYTDTTIAAVAETAGVAVATVYKSFGSKANLVKFAYDLAIAGDDAPVKLADRPQAKQVLTAQAPHAAVADYANLVADVGLRLMPFHSALTAGASASDPELRTFVAQVERERLTGCAAFARHLAKRGWLRITEAKARDILYLLTSVEVPFRLYHQRGWTQKELARWLNQTLVDQLLMR